MHVFAHPPQVARTRCVHHQRLVTPAEQVAGQLVPPCLRAARTGRRLNRAVQVPRNHFIPATRFPWGVSTTR
jgi:hypothetical protein